MPARTLDRSAVVEAARRCFLELGVRNATVEEVARRAGVSRATVYRAVGGRSDLVREVMLDEALVLFTNVGLAMGQASSATHFVAGGVAAALSTIRERPVLRRFAGSDLEAVLPVLTIGAAPLVAGAANMLDPILTSARDRGVIEATVDIPRVAEELVRYVLGLLHTPSLDADLANPSVGAERAARLFAPLLVAPLHDTVALATAATGPASE
jgi:AcrR family transcriptional regulator